MMLPHFTDNPFQVLLSFQKLIEGLEDVAANDQSFRGKRAKAILKKVARHPELKDGITDIAQIDTNAELIAELVSDLFPQALTKNEIKAISIPYQGLIFNFSERFKDILNAAGPSFEINIRDFDDHQFYILSCCIILNRIYNTNLDFAKPLFYDIPSAEGYIKHYRILYNAEFIDIIPTDKAVTLSQDDIDLLMNNYGNVALWKKKFPKNSWILKGFTIMTLFDATVENAVSLLKSKLIGAAYESDLQQNLAAIFRSIFRIHDLGVGFTAFNSESGKFSQTALGKKVGSFLLPYLREIECSDLLCDSSYKNIMQEHTYFAVSDVDALRENDPGNNLGKHFDKQNIESFILAPVVKNGALLGILELVSPRKRELNSVTANKLQNVMPFITDSIDRRMNELANQLRAIIQENYTTLHPSVYWRFRNEAQNYIHGIQANEPYTLKEVIFQQVIPLYGQVDIKDSSITRNASVKADLLNHLNHLITVFEQLGHYPQIAAASENLLDLKGFVTDLSVNVKADTEQNIQHYVEANIYPLILPGDVFNGEERTLIKDYLRRLDAATGDFHINRRNYEKTLSLVNDKIVGILDKRQAEIQALYPHYYERFKTDGVEHNIYIGPAINQNKKFTTTDLRRVRLWQLMVTAEMKLAEHFLKPDLPYQLSVASLILVFDTPISIRFRMDEKHFDIDGAYNIRYEVIKKRIDKALIQDTTERITRKGRITIIYTTKEEEIEYLQYIQILQAAGILANNLEHFNVEDLQGVSGLKGLRIGLLYDQEQPIADMSYDSLYEALTQSRVFS